MGRRVDVDQLVGASDIRDRLGFQRTQDIHTLRRRDETFPAPVAIIGGGPRYGIHVFYWPDVNAWARRKGITPVAPGEAKPPPKSARTNEAELVRMREELAELAQMRERLGELSVLRERLEALEAGQSVSDQVATEEA
jgi:hypothetical protein